MAAKKGDIAPHNTEHPFTVAESKFIDEYVKTGNGTQSVIEAGYPTTAPRQYAQQLLAKRYIADEIRARLEELHSAKIAEAEEILEYYTRVMRGQEKDQFGLEVSIAERTRAATELARRMIDTQQRVEQSNAPQIKISVDWERPKPVEVSVENDVNESNEG